jgi:hypothetical protein
VEAAPGFEPGVSALQADALTLGYAALGDWVNSFTEHLKGETLNAKSFLHIYRLPALFLKSKIPFYVLSIALHFSA